MMVVHPALHDAGLRDHVGHELAQDGDVQVVRLVVHAADLARQGHVLVHIGLEGVGEHGLGRARQALHLGIVAAGADAWTGTWPGGARFTASSPSRSRFTVMR